MSYRLRSSWLALFALLLVLPLGACKSNGSSAESAKEDSDNASTKSTTVDSTDDEVKDAPATDLYPGMNFGALRPKERVKFVEIAKAEVCPCPDAAESLHECLQDPKNACVLAKQVADMTAGGIRAGFSETDILDKVAGFVEAARKKHEFTLEDVPHKGAEDPAVTIVEFADFQCPACKAASPLMSAMLEKYPEQVAVYFKQYPLQSHEFAELAARAALAAHEQGKFWQMHDLLFEHQRALNPEKIGTFARRIGLNVGKFKEDLQSQEIAQAVGADRQEGDRAGITGTPAIFINGRRYMGQNSVEGLAAAVDAQLAEEQAAGDKAAGDKAAGSEGEPEE